MNFNSDSLQQKSSLYLLLIQFVSTHIGTQSLYYLAPIQFSFSSKIIKSIISTHLPIILHTSKTITICFSNNMQKLYCEELPMVIWQRIVSYFCEKKFMSCIFRWEKKKKTILARKVSLQSLMAWLLYIFQEYKKREKRKRVWSENK